jgi:hypothetical protein
VRFVGRIRSENVGMSNEKISENLIRRKPKVSWGRLVRPGLVGPKSRSKGVVDGQQVNIPVPLKARYQQWGDAVG